MGLFLALALALWTLGALMKVARRVRLTAIGMLYLAALAAQALPAGHPLREAVGGTIQGWLTLGLAAGLIAAYRAIIRALRRRVAAANAPAEPEGPFRSAELERYARHIVLREIGGPGQRRLKDARVLVIGAGGLGAPALLYLGAAGVGTLGVIDDDVVDASNLQRQVIHTEGRRGMPKVFSAKEALAAQNPHIEVLPYNRRLDTNTAERLFEDFDLILDGSDNFATRYLANRTAAKLGKPLVAAAISQWEGQISVYDPARGTPCYECVFPQAPAEGLAPSCAEAGVVGALPGVMGAMMAMEAIKAITGAGEGLRGRMLIYDALYAETRQIALKRRGDCPVCGGSA